jgi:hypothetical protein
LLPEIFASDLLGPLVPQDRGLNDSYCEKGNFPVDGEVHDEDCIDNAQEEEVLTVFDLEVYGLL